MILVIFGIVAAITILLILAAFQTASYVISRHIVIHQPKEPVFDYIRHIKNMDYYNKWVMTEPQMKKTFTGTDGAPGFIYAWDSQNKQAGKGEQEIKNIVMNERVDIEVRFEKPFKGVSRIYMTTEGISANETKVTTAFTGEKNFGMKLAHMLFGLEKVLGKDLEITLANLKQVLER